MLDAIAWFFGGLALSFYHLAYAITHPGLWLDWSNPEAIMRVVYYGGSAEFGFVVLSVFLVVTAIGLWKNAVLWAAVRGLEAFANGVGRFFAWAGLLMVLQQIVIVFAQRIFAMSELTVGLGAAFSFDISWWSEELKLYNAMIVTLCCAYTFVQGGHVRVDLAYTPASFRTKRVIDMAGSLLFMMPFAAVIWMYGWYYLWRHLVTPKVSATDSLDQMLMKARAFRWNVETIGFSPSGFNAYFLFKVLLVAFTAMVFLQAVAFFYRSYLEWKEGPASEGLYLDKDVLEPGEPELAGHAS